MFSGLWQNPPDTPVSTLFLADSHFVSQPRTGSAHDLPPVSLTPNAGDILVVKAITPVTGPVGLPSDGVNTYTQQTQTATNVDGFIWTAPVLSSAAITISATYGLLAACCMVVERWAGAKLAQFPATAFNFNTGTMSDAVITTGTRSIVSWLAGDFAHHDGSARAYDTSSGNPVTETGYDYEPNDYTAYFAYQPAAAAGSQSYGLTAPTPMTWGSCGIEIQQA